MTSRGSPDSTTRPQRVREPSRTRWLCTAAVASRIGIGQRVASAPRSESTRIVCCVRTSREACLHSTSSAFSRPFSPALASYRHSSVPTRKRSSGSARSFSRSPGSSTGCVIATRRACSGDSSSRLPCEPTDVRRLITSVSRCGIDRRVRDLREVLLEVGRQQLRALGERRERGVDAHRAGRLLALDRHRRDHQAQVLAGVPEQALLPLELGQLGPGSARPVGQVLEVHLLLVEQRAVGPPARERVLQLVVADDAARDRVDEQHAAGLEPVVDEHLAGIEVEHAGLRGEHEQPVAGQRVARGAQAVAVERGADLAAVRERDRGGAVPRLEQRGVELVERADVVRHLGVVRPGRRDQHRQRVRGRAARHHEQLERGIERSRVGPALVDDREQLREVVAEQRRAQAGLARVHPRAVAAHRVDLAVVREVVERLGEVPRAERVRREARVHERDRRLDERLAQVGVVEPELRGAVQALVGQRRVREARDRERRLAELARGRGELDPAADHVQLAAERVAREAAAARHEQLAHDGLARARDTTDVGAVDGHVAPADRHLPLLVRDPHEQLLADQLLGRIARQEAHRDRVVAGRRQLGVDLLARPAPQERVRQLQQQARAVARLGIGAGRATVLHLAQHLETVLDDRVVGLARDAHDEAETTRGVVVSRVVQRVRAHVGHEMSLPSHRSEWINCERIL